MFTAASAVTAAHAQEAPAQDGLQEIVVTAQKRKESLQDVPVSVTALDGRAIANLGSANVASLAALAPSLNITTPFAGGTPAIFIRGSGLNDFNASSSSGIGIYVNGVYVASPTAQLASLFDLDRVEILRGPQGTLYGKNTTGGAIAITTKRPGRDFSGNLSAEYGRFDSVKLEGAVDVPLVEDVLSLRLAGLFNHDDGFVTNLVTGHRINKSRNGAGRLSLLFTPSSDFELFAAVEHFENRGDATPINHRPTIAQTAAATGPDGRCAPDFYYSGQCTDAYGYFGTGQPYRVEADVEGRELVDMWNGRVEMTKKLGGVDLVSVTGYLWAKRDGEVNDDGSPLDVIYSRYRNSSRDFSQELRLQSGEASALRWVAGAYFARSILDDNTLHSVNGLLRPLFATPDNPDGYVPVFPFVYSRASPYRQITNSYALFGQADYEVAPKLTLTAGLRYSIEKKRFSVNTYDEGTILLLSLADERTFKAPSGRIGIQYRAGPNSQLYATYNRGFKAGGFPGGVSDSATDFAPYRNETMDAFEVGSKNELFDRRLRFNLAAFYNRLHDMQTFQVVERNGAAAQILTNAASAKIYGLEIDMAAVPVNGLTATLNLAYLHARFGTYTSLGSDYSGNAIPQSPKFSASGSLAYDYSAGQLGNFFASVDGRYRTRTYYDVTGDRRLSQKAFFQLGARAGWRLRGDKFEFGLWGRNLTGKHYATSMLPIDVLGFDIMTYSSPRTYGAFATATF